MAEDWCPTDTLPTKDCPDCGGHGWHAVPVCCGRPVLVWQNGSVLEPAFEECCGHPEPAQEGCGTCNGAGVVYAKAEQQEQPQ